MFYEDINGKLYMIGEKTKLVEVDGTKLVVSDTNSEPLVFTAVYTAEELMARTGTTAITEKVTKSKEK